MVQWDLIENDVDYPLEGKMDLLWGSNDVYRSTVWNKQKTKLKSP